MEKMKSLADQLREQLVKPASDVKKTAKPGTKKKDKDTESAIMAALTAYDNSGNKSMVHARFDEKTARTMNQFKMATGIDVTKLVAFAVKQLFETYPELKTIIKQFMHNQEL